jgi:hypothetical protein
MSDHNHNTKFTDIVSGSEVLTARYTELCHRAIADAAAHGVALSPEDVLNVREVRNAVLGADLDEDTYLSELLALPELSEAAEKKAISEGNQGAREAALERVNRTTDNVNPHRRGEASARKISQARALGIESVRVEAPTDRNELLRQIGEMPDHRSRLRAARNMGLA